MSDSFNDPKLPAERRTELLLARMTLEEKIGQMCQYVGEPSHDSRRSGGPDNADEVVGYALSLGDKVELVRSGKVGSFLKVPGAREADYLQQLAQQSRLGIPLLIGTDAIHGHGMDSAQATIFPSPIGLATAFDRDLAERVAACTAREMRATGFHWTFSPNVDVVRDPRWGRTGETFGEDAFLAGELGVAMVRGYQGKDFSAPHQVLACAKHLVAGGLAENGLNGAPAEVSERTLHEVFYPPFIKTLAAGAYTVMPSHNEVNGVPCHADRALLTDLLRGVWKFDGFVISDWLDIERLHSVHRVAENRSEADRLAVDAGVDMHMHGGEFFDSVRALVQAGKLTMARIDAAARRILLAKFRLGLFERRQTAPAEIASVVCSRENLALALEASRRSIVLLENRNALLPLSGARKLLVTGPGADDQSLLGDWARLQPAAHVVTMLQGIVREAPAGAKVEHVRVGPIEAISDEHIARAVEAARRSDVSVAVVGENSLRDNPVRTSGENVDRASLDLPGRQLELCRALIATGKPLIVVLINGAPIASEWLFQQAAAVIETWEPGMLGGSALGEVLFGKYNPSGRLPISIPRSAGHIRSYYDYRPSAYHRGKFRFTPSEPLYPFGHGKSYTTFEYRGIRCKDELFPGQALEVQVDVANTGSVAGEDTVLLFLQDLYASVTRPVRALHGFGRVRLEPGQQRTVSLRVDAEAFSLLDARLRRVTEPGEFRLSVGQLEKRVWVRARPR